MSKSFTVSVQYYVTLKAGCQSPKVYLLKVEVVSTTSYSLIKCTHKQETIKKIVAVTF